MLAGLKAAVRYLRDRALESSTWKDVGLAVAAGALLPAPWSYYAAAASLAGSLLKDWKLGA